MKQKIFFGVVLWIAGVCCVMLQALADPPKIPAIPVGDCLEMVVEIDGMKDKEGVRSVYLGDAVYAILSVKNISQKELRDIRSLIPSGSERGFIKLRVLDDDSIYTFYRERRPPLSIDAHVHKIYVPQPLFPDEIRRMVAVRIEFPPLEDQDSPFWMAVRKRMETEGFVACELDIKLERTIKYSFCLEASAPVRIYPRAALMPVEKCKAVPDAETVRRQQGSMEMALLDQWQKDTPAYFFPVIDQRGRGMTKEGAVEMFEDKSRANTFGYRTRQEFSLLRSHLTRKPMYPNAPTTVEGWRELEEQFSPSTVRDEIQLRRMIFERALAVDDEDHEQKHQEIVAWLMTLPYAQRTIMANDFDIHLPKKDAPKK